MSTSEKPYYLLAHLVLLVRSSSLFLCHQSSRLCSCLLLLAFFSSFFWLLSYPVLGQTREAGNSRSSRVIQRAPGSSAQRHPIPPHFSQLLLDTPPHWTSQGPQQADRPQHPGVLVLTLRRSAPDVTSRSWSHLQASELKSTASSASPNSNRAHQNRQTDRQTDQVCLISRRDNCAALGEKDFPNIFDKTPTRGCIVSVSQVSHAAPPGPLISSSSPLSFLALAALFPPSRTRVPSPTRPFPSRPPTDGQAALQIPPEPTGSQVVSIAGFICGREGFQLRRWAAACRSVTAGCVQSCS